MRAEARRLRDAGRFGVAHRGTSPAARARRKGVPCTRCHQHHVKDNGKIMCNGHSKRAKQIKPCGRPPIKGGEVCEIHGGGTPKVQANAIKRLQYAEGEGEVAAMLRQLDMPDQHPIEGLLEVVRHTGGMFRLLGQLCSQLKLDPVEIGIAINEKTGEVTKWTKDTALYGYDHTGDQAPHVLLTLYKNWATEYARACKLALDANIDERLVRNAEHTSHAMFTAVQKALAETDMDPATAVAFTKSLANQLRSMMDPFSKLEGGNGQAQATRSQGNGASRSSGNGQEQAKAVTAKSSRGQGSGATKAARKPKRRVRRDSDK